MSLSSHPRALLTLLVVSALAGVSVACNDAITPPQQDQALHVFRHAKADEYSDPWELPPIIVTPECDWGGIYPNCNPDPFPIGPYPTTDPCTIDPYGPGCPLDPANAPPPSDGGSTGGSSPADALSAIEESLGGCQETDGAANPPGGGGTWNPAAFAATLRANAGPKSQGKCAHYVREALCNGNAGVTGACDAYQHPTCAKDFGPFLQSLGFSAVASGSGTSANGYPAGYSPQVGDIAVFNYDPAGHVAGWDGTNWTSDFIQPDLQPSPNSHPDRPYTIYRRAP